MLGEIIVSGGGEIIYGGKMSKDPTEIYNKFKNNIDELYESIKEGCETYGELEQKLTKIKREILWEHPEFNETLFEMLKKKMNDEKKELPIKMDSQ